MNVFKIIDIFQVDSALKYVYFNNVIVYNSSKTIIFITILINEYQNFFVDKKTTIDISKKKMFINLKTNAITKSTKIYSFEYKNKKIINKTFNKLHKQKKMRYITQLILFNYLMFVV